MPSSRRLARRRRDLEMRIEDGAKIIRRDETRHKFGRRPRRDGEHEAVVLAEHDVLVAETQRADAVAVEFDLPQPRAEARRDALRVQVCVSAGSMKAWPSPPLATSGRQAAPPAASVSRSTAPASVAEASRGSVLSADSSTGPPQPS